jgi:hypothetical protein
MIANVYSFPLKLYTGRFSAHESEKEEYLQGQMSSKWEHDIFVCNMVHSSSFNESHEYYTGESLTYNPVLLAQRTQTFNQY